MKGLKYSLSESGRVRLNFILKAVLEDVKPSDDEINEAKFAINEIMGRLKKHTPKDVEILLAGSVARGTQVKGNSDIDIFLLFPRSMKDSTIEWKGIEIAKKIVNKKDNESYIIKYAEHPYARLLLNDIGINVDIVPAYKIKDANERGTAVDRTQLHNEFVNQNLAERQRDDVRILKSFLKAHNIYGAEAKVEGFSGYLCELLVYHYGSFVNVATAIANAGLPLVINTIGNSNLGVDDLPDMLKRFSSRFIVIDPTDSNRNVAANVSHESFFRFVLASRLLLKSPSKEMFYGARISYLYAERRLMSIRRRLGAKIYLIHFKVPEIANEIIWQQLKKARLRLNETLKDNGFEPLISLQNVDGKDAIIGLMINSVQVGSVKVIGPGIEMGDAVERFIRAHDGTKLTYIENDRICSIETAKYPTPEKLINAFISSKLAKLPSYLKPRHSALYVNRIPERYAKLLYIAYSNKFSI